MDEKPTVGEALGIEPVFQAKAIGALQLFTASQLLPSAAPIRRGRRGTSISDTKAVSFSSARTTFAAEVKSLLN
jgi:hypothetical protein